MIFPAIKNGGYTPASVIVRRHTSYFGEAQGERCLDHLCIPSQPIRSRHLSRKKKTPRKWSSSKKSDHNKPGPTFGLLFCSGGLTQPDCVSVPLHGACRAPARATGHKPCNPTPWPICISVYLNNKNIYFWWQLLMGQKQYLKTKNAVEHIWSQSSQMLTNCTNLYFYVKIT